MQTMVFVEVHFTCTVSCCEVKTEADASITDITECSHDDKPTVDADRTCFNVKIEADSNDITEHPHDDKARPYLCTVCDKRFTTKGRLNRHKQAHTGDKLYSCTQCEKLFPTLRYLKQHMNVLSSKYNCTECGRCFSSKQNLNSTQPKSFWRETI